MATQTEEQSFATIDDLAQELRNIDKTKIVIFANNGTGKTRLSVAFKDLGKIAARGDTLYYNAYTEDLFYWDNDLDNDTNRELHLNLYSHFFDGLNSEEMATRIRPILRQYVDFDFDIQLGITRKDQNGNEYTANYITFKRQEFNEQKGYSEWSENIKISRGEENIFKWCFFVAIAQLALNNTDAYSWVKNIFIDDPISSLDDDHAIASTRSHYTSACKTVMLKGNPQTGKFQEVLVVPSGGDTSYGGLLVEGDEVWMSYYSTHEAPYSCIYLAKVPLSLFKEEKNPNTGTLYEAKK